MYQVFLPFAVPMANGTGLLGTIGALQNVVITPSATNASIYYIFTSTPFFDFFLDKTNFELTQTIVSRVYLLALCKYNRKVVFNEFSIPKFKEAEFLTN
jgi:hypothetical protein